MSRQLKDEYTADRTQTRSGHRQIPTVTGPLLGIETPTTDGSSPPEKDAKFLPRGLRQPRDGSFGSQTTPGGRGLTGRCYRDSLALGAEVRGVSRPPQAKREWRRARRILDSKCRGRDSNPHDRCRSGDFKSPASTSSTTPACSFINKLRDAPRSARGACVRIVSVRGRKARLRRAAASFRSRSETIAYRSNTARVLWPESFIATPSGMPARTMLPMAVRRQSWIRRPVSLAAAHARRHAPKWSGSSDRRGETPRGRPPAASPTGAEAARPSPQ